MSSKKDLTEQQLKFVEYIRDRFPNIDRDTYQDAKAYAGFSPSTSVASILKSVGEKLKEEVVDLVALYGIEAAAKQIHIMRDPSSKWRAEHASSSRILDMLNIGKEDQSAVTAPVGIVFLPAKEVKNQE